MLVGEFCITIPGKAATKGSLRCIARPGQPHRLIEQTKGADPWRKTVAGWLTRKRGDVAAVKGQPLGVEVTFTLDRPKSHYRTKRDPHTGAVKPTTLKPDAPAYPVGHNTGDVDKLVRLILDAMQDAELIPDDCAVVELTTRKAYPIPGPNPDPFDRLPYPGVRIRLFPQT